MGTIEYELWYGALNEVAAIAHSGLLAARGGLPDKTQRWVLAERARRCGRLLNHLAETLELETP